MVPIAKAALVTLLLGCGTAGTFALANGGFGIGTATENSNEQNSDVPPASTEVANAERGNTDEVVSVPGAGTNGGQGQVRQEETPGPNVGDAGTREGKTITEEATDQPQSQSRDSVPPSEGGNDGLQKTQTLTEGQRGEGISDPVAPEGPDTTDRNEAETSLSDGHQGAEVTTDEGRENAAVQQPANAGKESNGEEHPQGPTQESAGQTSEDGAKAANAESDGSLQVRDATPPVQSSQAPEQVQVSSELTENAVHTDTLDARSSSDPQKNGVSATISSSVQA